MTQNEYKVGDKVRTKRAYAMSVGGCANCIPAGEEGVIEDVYDDELYVYISEYHIYLTLPISEVELIQPLDRRTDFLRRLGALLREFDARIYDGELYSIHIELGYHSAKSEQVDYLFYKSDNDEINADNIMDFDKE